MSDRFVLRSDDESNSVQPAVFSAREVYGERRELSRG